MADLGAAAFERRLAPGLAAPVCVAFSGGGDSLAALLAARDWAARCGRRLIALTVDHRLQAASAGWTAFAAEVAGRLGVGFQALAWAGEKPARGLAAAARAARHRLLAEAARDCGARVVVLGHTADDILESDLMRSWGSTLGALREWSPSPAWPDGRGVFLLRPLLDARRAELRAWLDARGERWIDDPANVATTSPRARARRALAGAGVPARAPSPTSCAASLAETAAALPGGALTLPLAALREASVEAARRWIAVAALSVGGGGQPPRGERLAALTARLLAPQPMRSTLCGARIIAEAGQALFVRDAGEASRGGLEPLALAQGRVAVWDGRFELIAERAGLSVGPLGGRAARLDAGQRRALAGVPAAVRPGLPALIDPEGRVTCPLLAPGPARLRELVGERMRAACGAISKEPAA